MRGEPYDEELRECPNCGEWCMNKGYCWLCDW